MGSKGAVVEEVVSVGCRGSSRKLSVSVLSVRGIGSSGEVAGEVLESCKCRLSRKFSKVSQCRLSVSGTGSSGEVVGEVLESCQCQFSVSWDWKLREKWQRKSSEVLSGSCQCQGDWEASGKVGILRGRLLANRLNVKQ
jgi:hypothetical protein